MADCLSLLRAGAGRGACASVSLSMLAEAGRAKKRTTDLSLHAGAGRANEGGLVFQALVEFKPIIACRGWDGGCGEHRELSLREYAAWWRRKAAGRESGALYVKDWHFDAEFPGCQARRGPSC